MSDIVSVGDGESREVSVLAHSDKTSTQETSFINSFPLQLFKNDTRREVQSLVVRRTRELLCLHVQSERETVCVCVCVFCVCVCE